MILGHCPLVVDDTRLILGVDSVVAINNLPHFGVLTHKSWLSGQQYSHHLQRGLGRYSVPLSAGICMEYVPSYLPRVTPPQLDTLWFLVPGSRKTAKHPQLLTRVKQRWQLVAAGSLRDISTHSMVWAFWCVHCSPTRRGLGANVYYESQWISCVQVQESPSPDREILTPSILYKFYPFSPAGCGWLWLVRTLQHFQYILLFMFTEHCGHRLDPITRQNMESAIFKFANWTDFVWIV